MRRLIIQYGNTQYKLINYYYYLLYYSFRLTWQQKISLSSLSLQHLITRLSQIINVFTYSSNCLLWINSLTIYLLLPSPQHQMIFSSLTLLSSVNKPTLYFPLPTPLVLYGLRSPLIKCSQVLTLDKHYSCQSARQQGLSSLAKTPVHPGSILSLNPLGVHLSQKWQARTFGRFLIQKTKGFSVWNSFVP